ncbi:RNA 2',3'-cyclic phosphodiesterase [Candidatus Woesearchaeota archaeon]|nr:RNA 2',3'-cyclic phosphodiesterase [Candidatus Woesearchaeota archaeon]
MRLFVAIDIPEEIKKQISEVQNKLKFTEEQAKCTPSKEQHITLKFLGEVSSAKLQEVKDALKKINFRQFIAKINTSASFANELYLRVAWFVAEPQKEFNVLYAHVDQQLKFIETKEVEQFIPHVTLARFKYVNDKAEILKLVKSLRLNAEWPVNSFKLIESNLTPQGPIYKVIEEYELST